MTREESWNRIDAIIARHEIDDDYVTITSVLDYDALRMARKALEQEPRKITYEDVKGYCKPRCLTIIDNELLYELTHPKIKALEQDPKTDVLDKIRAEVVDAAKRTMNDTRAEGLYMALKIIDKYRKEQE